MKNIFSIGCAISMLLACNLNNAYAQCRGCTPLGGTLSTTMVLPSGTRYCMDTFKVDATGRLEIEDGVEIFVKPRGMLVVVPGGELEINGTEADPVIFTSDRDISNVKSP